MSRASRYPFYHSLRDLTLERISIPDPEAFAALPIGVTGQRESEHEIFDTVEVDNKNLSRVFGDREHMDLCLGLTYPQFLTDVSITTTSFGFSEPKPFQPVHHRGAFSFLSASAHTLRRLKITASTFSTPINSVLRSQYLEEPGFTVYPALKHLEIIIPDNRLYQNFVEEWVHRFPNVEVLNVHAHLGMYMWAGDAEYNIYLRLEHLRHVKLPWPGTITPLSHQMGVELVRRVVSFWMLRGMPHLEDIQFVELDSTCRERATTCTVSRKPIANSSITGGNDELGWSMEWHEDPEEAQGGNCFFSDDFYRNGYGDVDLQLGAFTDSL
ncbi:hypothetical protein DRE_00385 [Drechslerella stenobrocha 248]|uniref:Uncharacterized protein n=1 Tax=Drechslerella stenobrocha 248 TaxID=1043628 RepID=W7I4P0_9PEZI|nr:hypothetical protein DRE_00385 [Drechslerella stenobrocha 248]